MTTGAGTHEGYHGETVDTLINRRGRLVWRQMPTGHDGPPYAWETVWEEDDA